ncbi:hypothetical protein [Niabella aquatica]
MDTKTFTRIKKINDYICRADTGKPKELAIKLKLSESQLYQYINVMKQLGAPIVYCRKKNTYYYTKPGSFSLGFEDF